MTEALLQLRHYIVEEVYFRAHFHDEFGDLKVDAETTFLNSEENSSLFQVILEITVGSDEPAPYDLYLVMRGIFEVNEEALRDTRKRDGLVTCTGPSILYGAARDFVRGLTASGPHDAFILPTKVFPPAQLEGPAQNSDEAVAPPAKKNVKKSGKASKSK